MTCEASQPESKGDRTRARLIMHARRRFGTDSFASVSVSQIARDSGLTASASYAYFPDKGALHAAAIEAEVDEWIGESLPDATGERPIVALFIALIGRLDDFPLVARTLRDGDADTIGHLLATEPVLRLRAAITATLVERQSDGRTRSDFAAETLAVGIETIVLALFTIIVRVEILAEPERVEGLIAVFQSALGTGDGTIPDFAPPPRPSTRPPKD